MKKVYLLFLICVHLCAWSQQNASSISDQRNQVFAFTHATIFQDVDTKVENATLLIEKDQIIAVGKDVQIPKHAKVIDLQGKYIYPSFIDVYTNFGVQKPTSSVSKTLQYDVSHKKALVLNDALHPEIDAYKTFKYNEKEATVFKSLGFGAVVTHQQNGISRGTSALVALINEHQHLLKSPASAHYSFSKGNSKQEYPKSLMGMIALLRQAYYDAQTYQANQGRVSLNLGWEAWNQQQSLPQIFEANDKLHVLRADNIAQEFGVSYWMKGKGNEYQIARELKDRNIKLIEPVNFPAAIDVSDPYEADWVYLKNMKEWEWAPKNLAILHNNEIPFVLTTADLKDKKAFIKNLQLAISAGIPAKEVLRALTETPSKLLKVEDQIGSLYKGKKANFLITSHEFFDKKNSIYENWILGKKQVLKDMNLLDIRGNYDLIINNDTYRLNVKGSIEKPSFEFYHDSTKFKATVKYENPWLILTSNLNFQTTQTRLAVLMSGDSSQTGTATSADGSQFSFSLTKTKEFEKKKETEKTEKAEAWKIESEYTLPFQAYGHIEKVTAEKVLIQHATIWTNEIDGILEDTDVLLVNGKIQAIGENLSTSNAKIIDATGKHLTAGIIDEHSHIAIQGGVNEYTNAVTAQVRIGDVINHEDINIYRQLGGGVTAIQQLHGSANPIGGQSSLIKLRWGELPEDLKIKGADWFIKFALGENVKQANWGDKYKVRYPQTRMGVEQIYRDIFTQAKEYEKEWNTYNSLSKKAKKTTIQPRKDLTLETVLQIVNSERFITCHSYIQSEILMLMQVAEEFGFRVNTFTHVLEGYKVVEQLKKHGAYASTFADWWAYKFEVNDAIPYNAALLTNAGVITAINSDYPEPGRRLNIEAGKLVKYGNMSEEEAWKTVTLNPAKMLHLDHRMGSIKVGKDADVVLWSNNPLSIYAVVEQTYVDGKCLYDLEQDKVLQKQVDKERNLLIQKLLKAKADGTPTVAPTLKREKYYHCEDIH